MVEPEWPGCGKDVDHDDDRVESMREDVGVAGSAVARLPDDDPVENGDEEGDGGGHG